MIDRCVFKFFFVLCDLFIFVVFVDGFNYGYGFIKEVEWWFDVDVCFDFVNFYCVLC